MPRKGKKKVEEKEVSEKGRNSKRVASSQKTCTEKDKKRVASSKTCTKKDYKRVASSKTCTENDEKRVASSQKTCTEKDEKRVASSKTCTKDENKRVASSKTCTEKDENKRVASSKTCSENDEKRVASSKTCTKNDDNGVGSSLKSNTKKRENINIHEEANQIETTSSTEISNDDFEIISVDSNGTNYDFYPLEMYTMKQLCRIMKIPSKFLRKNIVSRNIYHIGRPLATRSVTGDGNCLFRAISYSISNRQEFHGQVRKAIVDHCLEHQQEFQSFLEPQFSTVQGHVKNRDMYTQNKWGTALEIIGAADLLKTDIYTYFNAKWIKYSSTQISKDNIVKKEAIYLNHCLLNNVDHFEVVTSVEESTHNMFKVNTTEIDIDKEKSDGQSFSEMFTPNVDNTHEIVTIENVQAVASCCETNQFDMFDNKHKFGENQFIEKKWTKKKLNKNINKFSKPDNYTLNHKRETMCDDVVSTNAEHVVIRGSFHQGNPEFRVNVGKQCVTNCLAALVQSKRTKISEWKINTLDNILHTGNDMYTHIHGDKELLFASDIPELIKVSGIVYHYQRNETMAAVIGSTDFDFVFELGQALQLSLFKTDGCFICIRNTTIVIIQQGENLFLFDSHARNRFGLPDGNGRSILMQMRDVHHLHEHCVKLAQGAGLEQFDITGVNIKNMLQIEPDEDTNHDHLNVENKLQTPIVKNDVNYTLFEGTGPMNSEYLLIHGNFHQGHSKFKNNAGKQCVTNCLAALVQSKRTKISEWKINTLDNILHTGNDMYTHIHGDNDLLFASDIPELIKVSGIMYHYQRNETMAAVIGSTDFDFVFELDQALKLSLFKTDGCFICIRNTTIVIIQQGENLFLFDSHARNRFGLPDGNGRSILMQMRDVHHLHEHCVKLAQGAGLEQFDITGVNIKNMLQIEPDEDTNHDHLNVEKKLQTPIVTNDVNYTLFEGTGPMNAEYVLIHGNFHQGHSKFKNNAGKQCVTNCLAALVQSKRTKISEWKINTLDNILHTGNDMYTHIHGDKELLFASDIPEWIKVSGIVYHYQRNETMAAVIGSTDFDFVFELGQALQLSLFKTDGCFICIRNTTIVIIQQGENLFLFDSHARNRFGLPDGNGRSILMQMRDVHHLHEHCVKLAQGAGLEQFDITGVNIKNMLQIEPNEKTNHEHLNVENKLQTPIMKNDVNYTLFEGTGQMNAEYILIHGNFHQSHFEFKENAGKQCVTFCLAALVQSKITKISEWNESYLDNILRTETDLYSHIHNENELLFVSDLPEWIEVSGLMYHCDRKESMAAIIEPVDIDFVYELNEALEMSLFESDGCFICFRNITFLIIQQDGNLYLFNSHARNRFGLPYDNCTSLLMVLRDISHLYEHCLMLAQGSGHEQFDVTGIKIKTISKIQENAENSFNTGMLNTVIQSNANHGDCLRTDIELYSDECYTSDMDCHCSQDAVEDCYLDMKQANSCEIQIVERDMDDTETLHTTEKTCHATESGEDYEFSNTTRTMYDFKPLDTVHKRKLSSCLKIPTKYIRKNTSRMEVSNMGTPFTTKPITNDGNSFFRALSYAVSNRQEYYDKVQKSIVNHCLESEKGFSKFLNKDIESVQDYIEAKSINKQDTEESVLEIVAASDLLQTDIYIYMNETWKKYSTNEICDDKKVNDQAIYLCKKDIADHFECVLSVKEMDINETSYSLLNQTVNVLKRKLNPVESLISAKEVKTERSCKKRKRYTTKSKDRKRKTYNTVESDIECCTPKISKSVKEQMMYSENHKFRDKKKSASLNKYHQDCQNATDDLHRENVKTASVTKYATDDLHRENVKTASVTKYATDDLHRENVKTASVTKYATDDLHRENVKTASVTKYATDDLHHENVKMASVNKYAIDDLHRECVISASVKKYATNDSHRKCVKIASVRKYTENESFRLKVKEQNSQRRNAILERNKCIDNVINDFKKQISVGPEYVCACCFKLCFMNQVIECKRESYEKKGTEAQAVSEICISDKYLHKCSDECPKDCLYLKTAKTLWICYTCHRKIMKGKKPAESFSNKLMLEDIPKEMSCLNTLEQHLVSIHIPFIKILALPKGGQKGVHGPVVCVPSDIKKITSSLPRSEDENLMLKVKLKRKLSFKGYEEYQFVNTKHIEEGLEYLKSRNKWYSDITIDKKWLNPIPESSNENVEIEDTSKKNESEVIRSNESEIQDSYLNDRLRGLQLDTCLQPADIGQEALDLYFDQVFNLAPAEENSPIGVLTEEGNEAKTFPCHFPSGSNSFDEEREERLTLNRYFNLRLMHADNRFARDTSYIFFSQYLNELTQVMSNVQISLRKGSTYTNSGEKITQEMITDNDTLKSLFRRDEAIKYLKPVRGTPPFWQAAQKDIFAMIRQLGLPTFFCSFSSADFRWTEMIETVLKQQNDSRKIDNLDWNEKCAILRSNPVTVARMFDQRFHAFLNNVIKSKAEPIGKIKDYFYRVEFQQRGSPHTHCLFWVEDAPKLDKDSDDAITTFVDKYITCQVPSEVEDPDLYEIVNTCQQHSKTHSKSCKKRGTSCRFNFPRPPSCKTFVSRPTEADISDCDIDLKKTDGAKDQLQTLWNVINDHLNEKEMSTSEVFKKANITQDSFEKCFDLITKRSSIVHEREPNEIWTNQYNPHLLRAWNANMDIQYIMDAYSCVVYIISYISKAEREMGLLLQQTQLEAEEGNLNAQQTLRKVGTAYLHHREVSAQEAVFRVTGLRLKECSRKVQFIPTGENPSRMSKPLKDLKTKRKAFKKKKLPNTDDANDQYSDEEENIWMTSFVDRYEARPKKEKFENMCLATFCSEYRVLYESQVPKKMNPNTTHELQKGLGYIQQRTKSEPAVIRFARFCVENQPEKYYQSILQLFLPYRTDQQLKPPQYETYENFYKTGSVKLPMNNDLRCVRDLVDTNMSNYVKNDNDLQAAEKVLEQLGPQDDAWALLCPETEVNRHECIDEGVTSTTGNEEFDTNEIPELGKLKKSSNMLCTVEVTRKEIMPYLRSMNEKQRSIFYKIREWCIQKAHGEKPQPFHLFITGGAGTGKSHLIKCIFHEATRILAQSAPEPDDITVMLTAPTGTAAFNIDGMTIHSALSIFRGHSMDNAMLTEDKINTLRSKLENLQILIIDEISMVNKRLLFFIHQRLRQIKKARENCLFGNVAIIAVGDFYQLPPIRTKTSDKLFINAPGNVLNYLWHGLFSIVELNEVMRQREDEQFAQLLNRLRIKSRTDHLHLHDVANLKECMSEGSDSALHIYPTNDEVNAYNQDMIKKVCEDIQLVEADDFDKTKTTGKLSKRKTHFPKIDSCLPTSVLLAVGARIILTRNEDIRDGLVNGVMGTVTRIERPDLNSLPKVIYIHFDNEKVGRNASLSKVIDGKKCVGLQPVKEDITEKNGVRKQYPLKLAWACTVHKVQGMTVSEVVVDINKSFTSGQSYVALSRVTSKHGLHIAEINEEKMNSKIYCDPDVALGLEIMPKYFANFNKNLDTEDSGLKIMLHNIQGLQNHIEDLRKNADFKNIDFICLTETWLKAECQINTTITNYNLLHCSRSEAYNECTSYTKSMKLQEHGGIGVFLKLTASVRKINLCTRNIECIALEILDMSIIIVTVYRPSSYPMSEFLKTLCQLVDEVTVISNKCIIIGDFNQDLFKATKTIEVCMASRGFQQLVSSSTTENGTLIDHVYVKNCPNAIVSVVPTYYSYHEAVFLKLPNEI